jgi:N-acetylneuraminate synthase
MKPKRVDKQWGYELWLANDEANNYCGKILYIEPGHSSSMHYHASKHETFYILEGELSVEVIDTETTERHLHILQEGDTFVIDRFVPHQLSATGIPVKFIEISTFHRDEDSYRVWR